MVALSKPFVAAIFLIGLVLGVGIGYAATVSTRPVAQTPTTVEYSIGIMAPLSGFLPEFGAQQRDGGLLAVEDMNALLERSGSNIRFRAIVVDDLSTPEGAMKAVTDLVETQGVEVIAGPTLSSQTLGIKSYVDSHKIPVISSTASAPNLAFDDYIFRLVGADNLQGKAVAGSASFFGAEKAVIAFRDDAYGVGLEETFKKTFPGETSSIRLTPDAPDYAAEVSAINRAVEAFGANEKTALVVFTWEIQWVNIISHAMEYPSLSKILWIASDGISQPGILPPKSPPELAEFLIKVKAVGTTAHYSANPTSEKVLEKMREKYAGTPVDIWCLYMYDAVYLAMLSVLQAGVYKGENIYDVIPTVASRYFGATGPKTLDEFGDTAFQDYDLLMLEKTGAETFEWTIAGTWWMSTGTVQLKD